MRQGGPRLQATLVAAATATSAAMLCVLPPVLREVGQGTGRLMSLAWW